MSSVSSSVETDENVISKEIAAIDIGTTSIRMAVARFDANGDCTIIDSLHKDLSLGRDTFSRGRIRKSTVEQCVNALKQFRKLLDEYGITHPTQIRAVATSAVREASNRAVFLDRLYVATGFQIEIAEEADVSRLLYYAVYPQLAKQKKLLEGDTLIAEVAGGSTEMLHFIDGKVKFSHTYRLGSYRMRQMLDTYQAPVANQRGLMESQVQRVMEQMDLDVSLQGETAPTMFLIGGEARFVAYQLDHLKEGEDLCRISVTEFRRVTEHVLTLSIEELVETFPLTYPAAEALGPALISYLLLADYFKSKVLFITQRTMRDGLLTEIRQGGVFSEDIKDHILRASLDLGRKYHFHEGHAQYVTDLCIGMFEALKDQHRLSSRYGFLLQIATLLHEVGYFISNQSHHKHSMYLILNSEIFGLGANDLLLVSLIARYHRRSAPKEGHEGYRKLSREDKIIVTKLSAILRVGDALDRSHTQRNLGFNFEISRKTFSIYANNARDLTLEQIAINEKGNLFEEIYGLTPVIQKQRT